MKKMKKHHQKKKKRGIRKKSDSKSTQKIQPKSDNKSIQGVKETKKKIPPTISKREPEKRREEKGTILKYIAVAGQFLRESRMELKKVKWPTRKELLASTAIVLFLVVVVALFLGLIDFGLIRVIRTIIE
jgi:preprotein translocase subunit SecE